MAEKTICAKEKADGTRCKNFALEGEKFCRLHLEATKEAKAQDTPVQRDDVSGPDRSGDLCVVHFPFGWPDGAESAGCADGNFIRE